VTGWIEQLHIDRQTSDDANVAVIVVDLLLMVIALNPSQLDREGVGLAVVVGSHHRLSHGL
jgi:hypothetical protein